MRCSSAGSSNSSAMTTLHPDRARVLAELDSAPVTLSHGEASAD
jgi:hypothetical protein